MWFRNELSSLAEVSLYYDPELDCATVNKRCCCFLNLGTRWGWVVNIKPWPLHLREWAGTHCIGGWLGPRWVWMDVENLDTAGIWFLNCPACTEFLYQLCYPSPPSCFTKFLKRNLIMELLDASSFGVDVNLQTKNLNTLNQIHIRLCKRFPYIQLLSSVFKR